MMNNIDDYIVSDDFFNDLEEAEKELKAWWERIAKKHKNIWGYSIYNKIINTDIYYNFDISRRNNKQALGLTYKDYKTNELKVCISDEISEEDDDTFLMVLLHEMCHCAAYYEDGTLDHGKTWNKFVNSIEKDVNLNIKEHI